MFFIVSYFLAFDSWGLSSFQTRRANDTNAASLHVVKPPVVRRIGPDDGRALFVRPRITPQPSQVFIAVAVENWRTVAPRTRTVSRTCGELPLRLRWKVEVKPRPLPQLSEEGEGIRRMRPGIGLHFFAISPARVAAKSSSSELSYATLFRQPNEERAIARGDVASPFAAACPSWRDGAPNSATARGCCSRRRRSSPCRTARARRPPRACPPASAPCAGCRSRSRGRSTR